MKMNCNLSESQSRELLKHLLRELKPEQRKDLMEAIEKEDKLEADALEKNPNLHLENKLSLVLNEIAKLREDIRNITNYNIEKLCTRVPAPASIIEDDTMDCSECSLFSIGIDWWALIACAIISVLVINMPSPINKSRPHTILV